MFNKEQNDLLNSPLNKKRVKARVKKDITLYYLEGHDILECANMVFGYGNWSYEIKELEFISKEANQNQNIVISYKAIIRVTIKDTKHLNSISREDVGFGSGISKSVVDAHEKGAKEAVTDGIKRALRSFGNQFGNSLYAKSESSSNIGTKERLVNNHQIQYSSQIDDTSNNQANTQQSDNQSRHQPYTYEIERSPIESLNPQDYESLYKLGLTLIEQEGRLIVVGDNIFSKKDSIKACGFRWDKNSKLWYKDIRGVA